MFKVRPEEPAYAFVPPSNGGQVNQYGKPIQLVDEAHPLAGLTLNINNDSEHVSSNPDRYKQHGFHFTADNCIACHACEAACSEKNVQRNRIEARPSGATSSTAEKSNRAAIASASRGESSPRAIGRVRLIGCTRSCGASRTSFTR